MSELYLAPEHFAIVRDNVHRLVPECEVWAFGLRVSGQVKPYSNLDLVILGDEPLPLAVRVELNEAFCESDLPHRVDIVEWARASPEFRERIQHCHVVVQPACLSTGRSRPN
ncbi:MAG: nucleotidyltransferase domain-containing protein [Methylohalobius sp.]|nr:nucleotidyltransferase domain-containing protein [Methylohalobius sp.]